MVSYGIESALVLMHGFHAGVDFLWRLALEAEQPNVASDAALMIVQLNVNLSPRLLADQAVVRGRTIM